MRKPLGAMLLAVVVPATLVVPTVTTARPAPHPVAPRTSSLALAGVDSAALATSGVPRGLVSHLAREAARSATPGATALRTATRTAAALRPAVLTAQRSTQRFSTLGVTWPSSSPAGDLVVSVRTRSHGTWSGWRDLGYHSDEGPDGAESAAAPRTGTEPMYVGPSDGVQVRVDTVTGAVPHGLRVDLIDPGTSSADGAAADAAPPGSAFAAMGRPAIVTRADWGADESLRTNGGPYYSDTIKAAFVHHTVTANSYTRADSYAVMRSLYVYSVKSLGWSDIGYNFLVDKYGQVFEGRAGGIAAAVKGAATGGFNPDTMSVAALGDFQTVAPTAALLSGIARIIAYKFSLFYVDPLGTATLQTSSGVPGGTRWPDGTWHTFPTITGHRDADYTACPGQYLNAKLPTIRAQVLALMGANTVHPGISPTVLGLSAGTSVTVSAGVLTTQQWKVTVTPLCGTSPVRTLSGTATRSARIVAKWNGLTRTGAKARPGSYRVELTSWNSSSTAVPWSRVISIGAGSATRTTTTISALPAAPAGWFVPLTPTRVLSTRDGVGVASPMALGPGGRVDVPVLGVGGVPAANVTAVALQVTARCARGDTSIAVVPTGRTGPAGTAVSAKAGRWSSGTTVVAPGVGGMVSLVNAAGVVPLAADVVGYWTSDPAASRSGLVAVAPTRVLGAGTPAPLAAGQTVTVPVAGVGGVPSDASAVLLNVRQPAGGASSLRVWPSRSAMPPAGAVQLAPGEYATQRMLVPLGPDGDVVVGGASAATALTMDVTGYLTARSATPTGGAFRRVLPVRLTSATASLGAGGSTSVTVLGRAGVPVTGVKAVALLVTARAPSATSRLTVWPAGVTMPAYADLATSAHVSRTSLVVVRPGTSGAVRVANAAGRAGLTVDVVGWFG